MNLCASSLSSVEDGDKTSIFSNLDEVDKDDVEYWDSEAMLHYMIILDIKSARKISNGSTFPGNMIVNNNNITTDS